jgi:hypothetical protein
MFHSNYSFRIYRGPVYDPGMQNTCMLEDKFMLPGCDRVFTGNGEFLGFHSQHSAGNGNLALRSLQDISRIGYRT